MEDEKLDHVKRQVKSYRHKIHQIKGVAGTGITHSDITGIGKGHQVVVYLEKEDKNIIYSLPPFINGIPVIYEVTGKIKPLAVICTNDGGSFPKKYRPLQAGASIGKSNSPSLEGVCDAGTLGGFALLNDGSGYVILSNNHVIAHDYPGLNLAKIGDAIIQPGTIDGGDTVLDIVGTLKKWEPILDKSVGVTKADCAYAIIDPDISIDLNSLCNYGIQHTIEPKLGMSIKKAGRSTGCLTGTITDVDISIYVQYTSTGVSLFTGQIRTSDNFISGGDSGSVVVESDTNNALGLLFAGIGSGGGIFSKMSDVESLLGITFGCPDLSCSPITIDGRSGVTEISDSAHTFSIMTIGGYAPLAYTWSLDGTIISNVKSFNLTMVKGSHTLSVSIKDSCPAGPQICTLSITFNVVPQSEIIICGFTTKEIG